MTQRLTQSKLYRAQRTLKALIAAVHEARVVYPDCRALRPRRLAGLSRFLKTLASMPHTADYTPYEAELKRKLIKAQHRLFGVRVVSELPVYSLANDLPECYQDEVDAAGYELRYLLRVLADVDLAD